MLSCQRMTLFVDVYWATILSVGSAIQFISAEHGTCLGISPDVWIRLEKHRALWIPWILSLWHLFRGTPFMVTLLSMMLVGLTFFSVPAFIGLCIASFIHICFDPGHITLVWCIWCAGVFSRQRCASQLVGKSLSHPIIRELQFWKCVCILSEGLCLWHTRCAHRFPYVFRWTPFFVSLCGLCIAIVYAQHYILKTKVSNNAIITSLGHGIAPSLWQRKNAPCV